MSLEAYEHQEYPFECLVNDLDQSHDASRNPLFDVMLVLQNNETNHAHFGHSKLTHIQPKSRRRNLIYLSSLKKIAMTIQSISSIIPIYITQKQFVTWVINV